MRKWQNPKILHNGGVRNVICSRHLANLGVWNVRFITEYFVASDIIITFAG